MKSGGNIPFAGATKLRSRFATIEVQEDKDGNPCIIITGNILQITGFKVGDHIDGIFQEGLVSLLRLD